MAALLKRLNSIFWHERFWLPSNVTWDDVANKPGSSIRYPELTDLLMPLLIAVLLIFVRRFVEHFIAMPIARAYRLQTHDPRSRFVANATLEIEYKRLGRHHRCDAGELAQLAKLAQMTEREVERWFRRRRNRDKSSTASRFCEAFWRFFFYASIWIYSIIVMRDKKWLWDGAVCFENFPHQNISSDIYWYYMIEAGFYWSLTFTLCMDVKRSDFLQMVLHHFITLSLMSISWVNNMVRIGTLILFSHDVADVVLELGKTLHYLKMTRVCDALFVLFAIVWVLTRLTYYPLVVIYPAMFKAADQIGGFFYMYYPYMLLLCCLYLLHVYWFSIIGRMAYYQLTSGHMPGDLRSDSELEQETPNNELEKNGENGKEHNSFETNNSTDLKKHN